MYLRPISITSQPYHTPIRDLWKQENIWGCHHDGTPMDLNGQNPGMLNVPQCRRWSNRLHPQIPTTFHLRTGHLLLQTLVGYLKSFCFPPGHTAKSHFPASLAPRLKPVTQFQAVGVDRGDGHCVQAWTISNLPFCPLSPLASNAE